MTGPANSKTVEVATVDEVWIGDLVGVDAAGVPVLLVNIDGTIKAYLDRCAHLRFPLSEGQLDRGVLTCRAHHWQYDVATGRGINPREAAMVPLAVEVRSGSVYVTLEAHDG
jgi:toluene monooxygenase system ferredoxin subunit